MTVQTVRRVVIAGPSDLRIERMTLPDAPPPGAIRVRSHAIGICGSDVHVLAGHHPFVTYPVYPGHEIVGEVEAVGDDVDASWLGERVVLEPGLFCGTCRSCTRGDAHLCESLRVMGFQAPGGMGEAFDAPSDRLHHLPASIDTECGALVEPLAVATRAIRALGSVAGHTTLVLGAGTIGLMCALVARADGADVMIADPNPGRRRLASDAFRLESRTAPTPDCADIVIECVGAADALRAGVVALHKGGTLLVVGVHGHDVPIQAGLIQDRELRIQGTLMYQRQDFERAMALLSSGTVDVAPFIGAHVPLDEAVEGFSLAARGGNVLKVLLHPM